MSGAGEVTVGSLRFQSSERSDVEDLSHFVYNARRLWCMHAEVEILGSTGQVLSTTLQSSPAVVSEISYTSCRKSL